MRCTNCGFEQLSQDFCGKCGSSLFVEKQRKAYWEEKTARKEVAIKKTSQAMESTEHRHANNFEQKMKGTTSYVRFLTDYFVQPSQTLAMGSGLNKYGMMSVLLFVLLFPLSFTILSRQFFGILLRTPPGGMELLNPGKPTYNGPSFLMIFGYTFLFIVAIIVISLVLFYVVQFAFNLSLTFKEVTGIYGAHLSPSIAIGVISLPFTMVKFFVFGYYLLFVSFILLVLTLPVYYVAKLFTRRKEQSAERHKRLFRVLLSCIVVLLTITLLSSPIGQAILLVLVG